MVGLKVAMVCFVALADMRGGRPAAVPDPAPVVTVETHVPTESTTETVDISTETAVVPTVESTTGFVAYSIYGRVPPIEWQRYLYDELAARGYEWYMPYAICQIQQESCWNQYSDNGHDKGLTQQKGIYWNSRAAHWGIPGASIWDPYAQLHVYACMMCQFLDSSGGDVGMALSLYFYGTGAYAPEYVSHVMSHLEALR